MAEWNLPVCVEIDGQKHLIRNRCDYRVVLDAISALNDNNLTREEKIQCALIIFYEDVTKITNFELAAKEMLKIISYGDDEDKDDEPPKPQLMDWEHDFRQLVPPINRVLGYSVRDENHYTHYYDFIGAYMEIGDCTFATIISIRSKRQKGKPLEKQEMEFYRENKKIVDLPQNLTDDEKEWLESDW